MVILGRFHVHESSFGKEIGQLVGYVNIHAEAFGAPFLHRRLPGQLRQLRRVFRINPFGLNELDISSWLEDRHVVAESCGPSGQWKAPDEKALVDNVEAIRPIPAWRIGFLDIMLTQIERGEGWEKGGADVDSVQLPVVRGMLGLNVEEPGPWLQATEVNKMPLTEQGVSM